MTLDLSVPDRAIRTLEEGLLATRLTGAPPIDVRAFGSRATRTARPFSDLDLAIIGDAPLSLLTQAALRDAFVESDLPFKVDVTDWATTAEPFRRLVQRDRVVLQPARPPGHD